MKAFHILVDVDLLLTLHVRGRYPEGMTNEAPAYVESLHRMTSKGFIKPGEPQLTEAGTALVGQVKAVITVKPLSMTVTPPTPPQGRRFIFATPLPTAEIRHTRN